MSEEIINYYRVEETSPDDMSTLLNRYTRGLQTKLFTGGPGEIVEFFPDTQTAIVQPLTRKYHRYENEDGTVAVVTKDLPIIERVPVQFPQAGDFHMTFPVKPGDECYIAYAQRTFDNWLEQGGIQDPSSRSLLHTINGAVAILGISSDPRKIPNFNPDDAEFRNREGDQVVQLKPNKDINIFTPKNISLDAGENINFTAGLSINAEAGIDINETAGLNINTTAGVQTTQNSPTHIINAPATINNSATTTINTGIFNTIALQGIIFNSTEYITMTSGIDMTMNAPLYTLNTPVTINNSVSTSITTTNLTVNTIDSSVFNGSGIVYAKDYRLIT